MRYTWIDKYLLSKEGVTKDLQKDWNWIRYQIGGKMFAAVCLGEDDKPYYLIFRWASWYVWGWCVKRSDFRLFKLNRMDQVKISEQEFPPRQVPMPDLSDERIFPGGIKVKALFEQDCKWRLVEEFGTESFRVQQDGKLLYQSDYTDKDNLIMWLLSFGEKAELLEPEEIREEIKVSIECMKKRYEGKI